MDNKLPLDREILRHLYNQQGQSLTGLSKTLNCSIHKVVYWMRKYDIKRRSRSDAAYLDQNPNGDPFHIKEDLDIHETLLLGLGIGIFLGEGAKTRINAVAISNSNPLILKLFLKFINKICGVKKEKIKYSIICFNDSKPEISRDYWSKELNATPEKFGKITQVPPQGKGTYKKKSKFGVCSIYVNNKKLRQWLNEQIMDLSIF